jgi:drug/metabolite transporter (DMT)-like permease
VTPAPLPEETAAQRHSHIMGGVMLRAAAMVLMSGMAALVKWCGSQGVPVLELIFFRNAFAFIPICFYIWRTCGFGVLRTSRPLGHLTRSAVGLTGMVCGFTALQHLPLTEATAIAFAAPLFMTALSVPILREPVGRHRWGAVLVGFVGVLIMVRPDPQHVTMMGAGLALAGAVAAAFAMITVREMGRTEPGAAIVFYFTLAGCLLGLCSLPFRLVVPDLQTLGLLVLIGVIGGVGQLMLTESLRIAPVGVVAPFDYTQLLWASVIGFLVWGELPRPFTIVGALIVGASGLYIVLRETRRFRTL